MLCPFFRIVTGKISYHLRICLYHSERGFKVMRNVGHKIVAQGFGFGYFGGSGIQVFCQCFDLIVFSVSYCHIKFALDKTFGVFGNFYEGIGNM